jgi:hypothetical protein
MRMERVLQRGLFILDKGQGLLRADIDAGITTIALVWVYIG